MGLYEAICQDNVIFGVSISGIVLGFLIIVAVLAGLIIFCSCDIRRRVKRREAEIKESERVKKQNNDGVERVLIYLAFMAQKGHYKMPKNKYPVDKCKQVLTDPVWDDNRRQALIEIAKFYDNAATDKDLDDPNSPYYGLSRRVPKGESGKGEESTRPGAGAGGGGASGASKRGSQSSVRNASSKRR